MKKALTGLVLAVVSWAAAGQIGCSSPDHADRDGGRAGRGGAAGARPGGASGSAGGGGQGAAGQDGGIRDAETPSVDPDTDGGAPGPTAEGLIGHWTFDTDVPSRVTDQSGHRNDAKALSGTTWTGAVAAEVKLVPGKIGNGVDMDGTAFLAVPSSQTMNEMAGKNTWTVSAWVKMRQVSDDGTHEFRFVVCRAEGGTRYEHFGLGLRRGYPTASTHYSFVTAPSQLPTDRWAHMATTYDGVTLRLYVDGAEVSYADLALQIASDTTPMTIGAGQNDDEIIERVDGLLDEVRLYDRALDPAEVAALSMK